MYRHIETVQETWITELLEIHIYTCLYVFVVKLSFKRIKMFPHSFNNTYMVQHNNTCWCTRKLTKLKKLKFRQLTNLSSSLYFFFSISFVYSIFSSSYLWLSLSMSTGVPNLDQPVCWLYNRTVWSVFIQLLGNSTSSIFSNHRVTLPFAL